MDGLGESEKYIFIIQKHPDGNVYLHHFTRELIFEHLDNYFASGMGTIFLAVSNDKPWLRNISMAPASLFVVIEDNREVTKEFMEEAIKYHNSRLHGN